jgi:hypothetical protein
MKPDRNRNDAMYWATRSCITSQPAITTRIVVKLLSRISSSDMPSMPR